MTLDPRLCGGDEYGFERAVPEAAVYIDGAQLDAVLARVAYDLRRRVEPHRLAVEQGAGENLRVEAFDPGRDVDEQCKARRVALGKTVGPEPLDLTEAAHGEIALVTVLDHAGDEFVAEQMDVAVALESRHRAAQPVGLLRSEAGADDRDLHRLLLEEWHAHGLAQHLAQCLGRVVDRLAPGAAAQIGVHHVALDRPRPAQSRPR